MTLINLIISRDSENPARVHPRRQDVLADGAEKKYLNGFKISRNLRPTAECCGLRCDGEIFTNSEVQVKRCFYETPFFIAMRGFVLLFGERDGAREESGMDVPASRNGN